MLLHRALLVLMAVLSVAGCAPDGGGGGGGTGGGSGGGTATGGGSGSAGGGAGGTGGGAASLPAPNVNLGTARESFDVFSFIPPATVTTQRFTDGIVFTNVSSPMCTLSLLPARQSTGNLAQQAVDTLLAWGAPTIAGLHDENGALNPLNFQHHVVTGDGFEGLSIFGFATDANGREIANVRTLLFDLGNGRVAPMIGVGDCFSSFGDTTNDWALVFYSLRLTGTPTATVLPATQLKGKWHLVGTTTFLGETYAANGHYATTSAYQTYSQVSATSVLETTTTFFGDGTWEAHDNRLTTAPTGKAATTRYFRIEEEMNSSAPGGWLERKYELDVALDGTIYEYSLVRDRQ